MISFIAPLLLVSQGSLQVELEAPDGSTSTHDLTAPLAAPLPEGVAFLRYSGGVTEESSFVGVADVELLDGGRVSANFLGGEGEFLDLSIVGDVRLRVSVDELDSVIMRERIPADWGRRLERGAEGDRLYRLAPRGLERLDGTLEAFTADGVLFTTRVGQKAFAWSDLCALFVESLGGEPELPPGGTHVVVDLADGGRVHGGLLEIRSDEMDLVTRAGRGLRLPRAAVAEVFIPGAGAALLSELAPTVVSAEGSPFGDGFGMVWPHRVDRSVTGRLLRADGEIYTRGLGVHAPSRLEWSLDGSWRSLRLGMAVDDEVLDLPAQGSVIFRVIVDGELRHQSEVKSAGTGVSAVGAISLEGAASLVLEVDMSDELHVADRADWLRPVLFGRDS